MIKLQTVFQNARNTTSLSFYSSTLFPELQPGCATEPSTL